MEIQGQENTPEQKELAGVSVIFHNITERIQSWVDAVTDAGATVYEEGSDGVISLQGDTNIKVAVIIGPGVNEDRLEEIVQTGEQHFSDPAMSIRYFQFIRKGEVPKFSHEKIRLVTYADMAPSQLPKRINVSLYKARLPHFLRTGYDVEIQDEVVELEQVRYRKVIIHSSQRDEKNRPEYQTLYLYIHNKELYEIIGNTPRKISENHDVVVRKGRFVAENDARFD